MSLLEDQLNAAASKSLTLQSRQATALALGANGSGVTSSPSDPQYRAVDDMRGLVAASIYGELGGTVVAAHQVGVQYHTDPLAAPGDAGWTLLCASKGGHTSGVPFTSEDMVIPQAARLRRVAFRPVIIGGNGTAVPTLAKLQLLLT